MSVLLGTIFVASLLGSLHCVGMCGPFAMMASNSGRDSDSNSSRDRFPDSKRRSSVIPATAYSAGRLATYTLVGVVFGALGMALNRGVAFAAWQQTATYVAGGIMILVGLIAIGRQFGWKIPLPNAAAPFQAGLQKSFRFVNRQPPVRRAFLIGGLTCLMPCGWLYTFAIVAAGTGSVLWGPLVMIVFWSGTVPIMVGLMMGWNRVGPSIQKRIPMAMACMVILIGVFTIAFRAPVTIGETTRVFNQTDQLIQQVRDIDASDLPCCED